MGLTLTRDAANIARLLELLKHTGLDSAAVPAITVHRARLPRRRAGASASTYTHKSMEEGNGR
jgi:hypothetical protein